MFQMGTLELTTYPSRFPLEEVGHPDQSSQGRRVCRVLPTSTEAFALVVP
jgi:hypothetical protein